MLGLGVLGLAVPVVAYFWFINRYALDVLYYDSWSNIYLIWHPFDLWNQHNENRMFFPNIMVVLLDYTIHFNTVTEEFLSGVMLVTATGLFIGAHKQRSPATPWLLYCPLALVMLSWVQAGSTLWGFQLAWYLIMLALAASLFLLDRPDLTRLVLAAAIASAVVGSYSSLQGLLIWPAGLLLLWQRRRSPKVLLVWTGSAVVAVALYFFHFSYSQTYSDRSYLTGHLGATLKLFFYVLGDAFGAKTFDDTGTHIPNAPDASTTVVIVLGVAVFALAVWVVAVYGLRRDETSGSPLGVAMVCFGVLYAASISLGRISPIPIDLAGGPSRYTVFSLLVVAGSYVAVLNRPVQRARRSYLVLRPVVVASVCLLVVLGTWVGLEYGPYWHQREVAMADITANLNRVPDSLVDQAMFPGGARYVRQFAKWAALHGVGPVASPTDRHYAEIGLLPSLTGVQTHLYWPTQGVILSGSQNLYAAASSPVGVTRVDFQLTGGRLHGSTIATARFAHSVWTAPWDSAGVADGTYRLRSVASTADGTDSSSRAVVVTVHNR
jgi:hypothetical protein